MPTFLLGEHQYTIIRITGQSFMLHQIRKMIGLALAVLRGYATEAVFDIVFSKERVDIPKAPGLGLMLNRVDFSQYNTKYQNDGIHQPIDWSKYEVSFSNLSTTCFINLIQINFLIEVCL
ncbi:tRNA pseudouridine38-40 synthase [Schistosoma bovis]|nr:tRNA pseudouridine38-40 synthase [Schistosoma bovis]